MENYLAGNLHENTAVFYDYDNREIIKDDLVFYTDYANQINGRILELACGTGRVSLHLAENTKKNIDCADLSKKMLDIYSNKLETKYSHLKQYINLYNADMSDFDLKQQYGLVLIPWRALQLLPEVELTIKCLECVYKHLAPDGLFIFEIFRPRDYDKNWVGREDISFDITEGGKRIIRSTFNHFADTKKQYIQYKNKVRIIENGSETSTEDMMTLKYYYYNEITEMLKNSKFTIKEEFGYYNKSGIDDGGEMIFVCSK